MSPVSRRATLTIWLLIGAIAAAAVGVWLAVVGRDDTARTTPISWLLLALAYAIVDRLDARIEVGGESYTINAADALLVIGLAYLPAPSLLAARALGDVVGNLLWHRSVIQKAVFNFANRLLETGIAAVVYSLVLGTDSPVGVRGWAAAALAVAAGDIVSHLTITAVISVSTGLYTGSWRATALQGAIMACNIVMGLVALDVLWVDRRGVWKILVGFLIASAGYQIYVQMRERNENLTALQRFAGDLAGATDSTTVVQRALTSISEILRAGDVQLVLELPDGAAVKRLDPTGAVTGEVLRNTDLPAPVHRILTQPTSMLIPAGDRRAEHRSLIATYGWSDLMSCPFVQEDGLRGVLVVGNRLADGSTFDAGDLTLLQTFASNTSVALRVGELVEQLRAQAAEKEHQSRHDALTRLPNRMVADERLRHVLPGATPESMVAVMFMDLDRFKEVNDALGHHVGDELLKEVALRLRHVIGRRGTVARLGGDEFAVVVPNVSDIDELTLLATELRAEIAKPVVIDRLGLNPLASVGIALAPHDGNDARSLFQRADVAMYAAKNRRTGFEYYDPRFDKASTRTLSLTADLRTALATDQLLLHYQPQADLNGRVVALEALARWPHPRYGSVPPEEFVHVAEQHGLIHQLTRWAIDQALTDLAEWRKTFPDLRVSVNMSAHDLMDLAFPTDVEELLTTHGIPAGALTLELTESKMLSDIRRSVEMLGRLRAMGVRLAVDDFGTGQSSLAYLRSLPIHEVKIDRSFVISMAHNSDDAVIVHSTIGMAHNLGLTAIAEGVEDGEVWRILGERGCDGAQGYHVTPALPARELTRWMNRRHEVFHIPRRAPGGDTGNVIRLVPRAG